MAVAPLAEQIIDEQAWSKWRIRRQGNEMGRWFFVPLGGGVDESRFWKARRERHLRPPSLR